MVCGGIVKFLLIEVMIDKYFGGIRVLYHTIPLIENKNINFEPKKARDTK